MISIDQLEQLAAAAGFPAAAVPTAAAIAMAESSGNPSAVGDNGNSFGLWQIYLPAHPEFAGWNLLDPATNAHAAFQVWSAAGGSFTPWSAYKSGAYLAYVPPLIIDAATGQAVDSPTSFSASITGDQAPVATGPSFATVALLAVLGIFTLWLVNEAT